MSNVLVELPIYYFGAPNKNGPLFNAKIYVGTPDLDPHVLANRKDILFRNEDGTDVPISPSQQPVRTSSGGYPTYNGKIGQILVDGNYSISVDNKNDVQEYYWPNYFKGKPLVVGDEAQIDHSKLSNLNVAGGHDAIYSRDFASVEDMISYTGHSNGLKYSTGGTAWLVTSTATTTALSGGLYAKPLTDVRLNDYAINGTDDSASILSAAKAANDGGVARVYADNTEQVGIVETVDLSGVSDVTIDFNYASFIDNVQTFFPAGGSNRAKPAFIIYNNKSCKVIKMSYSVHPNRATNSSASVPDILFWVGGQYLGSGVTVDSEVSGITFNGTFIGNMPICVFGEHRGFTSKNVDVFGDSSYGINFEYGLEPSDPNSNETMSNGRHPYNATVENFNGWELQNCSGFLRVASCYNVLFTNCQGYNTRSFFYVYGGDRNISRFSENVKFLNCKSKLSNTLFTAPNAACTILFVNEDGSTGDPLPAWTNYDHTVIFEGCEIQNNFATGSSAVRFLGNQGKTVFKQCIIRNSYYGYNGGAGSNPDYISDDSLKFEDCEFINNYQDVRQNNKRGVKFVGTKFKDQAPASTLFQVEHTSGAVSQRTKYKDCQFTGQSADRSYANLTSFSTLDIFDDCEFEMFGSEPAITSVNAVFGNNRNNSSNGLITANDNTKPRMIGQIETGLKSTSGLSLSVYNYDIADTWLVNSVVVLDGVTGLPKDNSRILFRGIIGGADATFNHDVGGTGRFLNKSGSNDQLTGNDWSKEYAYSNGIWYEI